MFFALSQVIVWHIKKILKCAYNSVEKLLNIREWTCSKCQAHYDRDINAAISILNKAKLTV